MLGLQGRLADGSGTCVSREELWLPKHANILTLFVFG